MTEGDARGTVVFDLDGVVYLGDTAVPGAGDALHTLEDGGWHLLFATNNSARMPDASADKIARLTGYRPDPTRIVTSGSAAAAYLAPLVESVYVVGEPGLAEAMRAVDIDVTTDAATTEAVVVGMWTGLRYEHIRDASAAIRDRGALFVATNSDATYPTPDGLAPGAGAVVAAIETASGVAPVQCGKPHAPMGDLVEALVVGSEVWMVGDRPETDLALAVARGWGSICPLTGIVTDPNMIPREFAPDIVVDSIIDVPVALMRDVSRASGIMNP